MKRFLIAFCSFAVLCELCIAGGEDSSSQEDKPKDAVKELEKNVSSLWNYVSGMRQKVEHDLHQLHEHQMEVARKLKSIFGIDIEAGDGHMHHMDKGGQHDDHDSHENHNEEHHHTSHGDHHGDEHHGEDDHHGDDHHGGDHHGDDHHDGDHHGDDHHGGDHHGDDHHNNDHHGEDHHSDHHHSDDHHGDAHHEDVHHSHSDSHRIPHSEEHHHHHNEMADNEHHQHSAKDDHSGHGHQHQSEDSAHEHHGHDDASHGDKTSGHQEEHGSSHDHEDHTSNDTTHTNESHHHHHQESHHGSHHHQEMHHHHHYSHHHHHSTSSKHPSKYDFAICNVEPNTAIPLEKQQNVTGKISLWQKKNGTTLHIHIKIKGFKMDGHGDHGEHTSEDGQPPVQHLHGFHVHQEGDLSNSCQSTGPHFNPTGVQHGGPTSPVRHVGDLGNIQCDQHGVTNVVLTDEIASLQGEYSIIGKSMVIHERNDDLGSNPDNPASVSSGDAGTRIACCVIEQVDRLPATRSKGHSHGHHHH